jgi:hypothetical protein
MKRLSSCIELSVSCAPTAGDSLVEAASTNLFLPRHAQCNISGDAEENFSCQ